MRFTGLQLTHNPGLPIIILAAALIFFSTVVTFYIPHRRVRALVVPRVDGGATMHLGAQVKLDLFGAREFEKLTAEIRAKVASRRWRRMTRRSPSVMSRRRSRLPVIERHNGVPMKG